jgi:endonuclease III-like uncharacterized protein
MNKNTEKQIEDLTTEFLHKLKRIKDKSDITMTEAILAFRAFFNDKTSI